MNKSEKSKRSFTKFDFTNNLKDFDETSYQSEAEIFKEERDWLILPKEPKKIELPIYDFNFGSKSTRAESKKTHIKPILFKDLTKPETKTIISESINEGGLSKATKNIIDDIIKNKSNNLIYKNKISFNNEERFSLLKSFSKNKEKLPKISDKTKCIIESLQKQTIEHSNNYDVNINKNDNMFSEISLSYKYEELISTPRKLPIPMKYKQLYNIFISLDNFISLVKLNQENYKNTFINFHIYMEKTQFLNITLNHLKQILFVAPYFFVIKFIKISNKRENISTIEEKIFQNYDLLIDIPKHYKDLMNKTYPKKFNYISLFYYTEESPFYEFIEDSLNHNDLLERKKVFLNLLYKIVVKFHDNFLFREKIICPFNPIEVNTWHHDFNVETECTEIPLMEFPLPKSDIPKNEIVINVPDTHNFILKSALEKTLNKNEKFNVQNENKYVSKDYINKLKRKTEIKEISEELKNIERIKQNQIDICKFYIELLNQIKIILLSNCNSMNLNEFSNLLLNSSSLIKNTIESLDQLSNILFELSKIYFDLFTIEQNRIIGKVIVFHNKEFQIPKEQEIYDILFGKT